MAGPRAKACRVGACSSLAGAQEPEAVELVTRGPPGPDSTTLGTGAAGGASVWRTTGEETSTRAGRMVGHCAALLARASRRRFSRSSSDTVLGLGRGLHGAGAGAGGMDAVRQACVPLPTSRQVPCFAASWAGTLWVRQPAGKIGRTLRCVQQRALCPREGPKGQGRLLGLRLCSGLLVCLHIRRPHLEGAPNPHTLPRPGRAWGGRPAPNGPAPPTPSQRLPAPSPCPSQSPPRTRDC